MVAITSKPDHGATLIINGVASPRFQLYLDDIEQTISGLSTGGGSGDPDQDLWATVAGDTGSTTANATTDTVTIAGGSNVTTVVAGDTITVSTSATVNATDAALRARSSHTGTQTVSTISDFDTEVSNNTNVAANTAKVSYTDAAAVSANTAKITFDSTASTKVGFISVTQAVDLDTMESNISTNNAKVSYTDAAAVSANTAKTTNATHTGDATGDTALTLATVNSNVGSFTAADITVNAKGLITAASNGSGADFYAPYAMFTLTNASSMNSTTFVEHTFVATSVTDPEFSVVSGRVRVVTGGTYEIDGFVGCDESSGTANYRYLGESAVVIGSAIPSNDTGARSGYIRASNGHNATSILVKEPLVLTAGQDITLHLRRISSITGNGQTHAATTRLAIRRVK